MMSLRCTCLGAAIVPLLVILEGCGPAPATASSLATLNKTQWITQANGSLNTLYQGLAGITATLNTTYGNRTDVPAPALLSAKTLFLSTYNSAKIGRLQQYGLPAWTSALVQRLSPIQKCASMSVSNSSYTAGVFFNCLRDGAAAISSARQWAQSQQLASYLTTTPSPSWDSSASSVAGAPSAWANSKSSNTGPAASDSSGSATSLGSKALGSSGSYMQIWQFLALFLVLCLSGASISAAVMMCVPRKKAKKTMNRKQAAPSPALAVSSEAADNGKNMGIFNYQVPATSDLSAFVEGRSTPSYLLPVIPPTVPIVRSERVIMTAAAASAPQIVAREKPAAIATEEDSGSFVSTPETAAAGSAAPLLGAPVNWATPSFMQQSSLTAQAGSSASAYYAARAAAGVFAYKHVEAQASTPVVTTFAAPMTMAAPMAAPLSMAAPMTAAITYAAPVGTYAAPGTTYAVPLNRYSAPGFAPPMAPPMVGPVPVGTDVNAMLDSRLEYMLHYLQMGKAVTVDDLESSQSRDQEVLQLVSGATAWKGESRSPQEVWNKIAELDGAMTRIVGG